ncbi:MAG: hypothetical protein HY302_01830 [Opitutae bacterium]|nr:hypothetical protein [Opitutae bacterium]
MRCPPKGAPPPARNYRLWQADAFHPSLHFESTGQPNRSVRVGDHYRAIGRFVGQEFIWQWFGTHAGGGVPGVVKRAGGMAVLGLVSGIGG